jgi:hypothetical protein
MIRKGAIHCNANQNEHGDIPWLVMVELASIMLPRCTMLFYDEATLHIKNEPYPLDLCWLTISGNKEVLT